MKPQIAIEIHPLQVKAIENGATAFLLVVDEKKVTKIGDIVTCIKPLWTGKISNGNYTHDHIGKIGKVSHISEDSYHIQVAYSDGTYSPFSNQQLIVLPLQAGDKFYLQEEFKILHCYDCTGCDNCERNKEDSECELSFEEVIYKAQNSFSYDVDDDFFEYDWQPASQMSYEQSRFKDLTASVEVKRVQELTHAEWVRVENTGIGCSYYDGIAWFNSIHGEGSYESNPYIFMISFTREGY